MAFPFYLQPVKVARWHECREPFKKPNGWLTWGLLGVVLAPVVIGITVTALTYSGYEVSHTPNMSCALPGPKCSVNMLYCNCAVSHKTHPRMHAICP